jgi:hypothetical protein
MSWGRMPLHPSTLAFAFGLPGSGLGNAVSIAATKLPTASQDFAHDLKSRKPGEGARMMSGWKGGSSANRGGRNDGGVKRQWGGKVQTFHDHSLAKS